MAEYSFEEMPRRIRLVGEEVEKNTYLVVRKAALVIDQAVVMGTPVDTGLARSNWIVTLDTPANKTIAAYAPGVKLGLGEMANAQAAIDHGQSVIAQWKGEGQVIVIQNSIAYIVPLNRGHSPQQGTPGFIERAIVEAIGAIRGVSILPDR